jgi:hypothetical protein
MHQKCVMRANQPSFIVLQQEAQAEYFSRIGELNVRDGAPYRLQAGRRDLNIAPTMRSSLAAYFGEPRNITWHTHADHGLSSQVCCLNFLAPLATQPALLARVIGASLGTAPPSMLPIEDGPDGTPWFVGFEWPGRSDYLDEWPKGASTGPRGQNATNADAIVRFDAEGRTETLLIEWKYTEEYGSPIAPKGNATRTKRYADKMFSPSGPIRNDLNLQFEDFLWEPFYQLLRQQMLALSMQKAREDGAERVRVLHISPSGNRNLHKVTSPAPRRLGDDAFDVFKQILVEPDAFLSRTTEQVFGALAAADDLDAAGRVWAGYLRDRYAFLRDA